MNENPYNQFRQHEQPPIIVQPPKRRRRRFRYEILRDAIERAREDRFLGTDEAQLVERLGFEIRVVAGSETNLKVTTAFDLALAEHYLVAEERP